MACAGGRRPSPLGRAERVPHCRRGVLYPWPYLDSWKAGGNKSPVAAVKAWKAKHGCPTAPTVDK